MTEVDPALRADARWQLIERIVASPPFQKSARLRDLLCYLAERTLHGQSQDLSEHRIGSAVFGKAQDYSVVEDSSVRVHVRQLRLKLHEYFDGEGRAEALVVEIPKGAYTTLFRAAEHEAAVDPTATDPGMKSLVPASAMGSGRAISNNHVFCLVSPSGGSEANPASLASGCAFRFRQVARCRW
jgi:hypothetical protein